MSFLCCASLLATLCSMPQAGGIDLTAATVVVRENGAPRCREDRGHGAGRRGREAHRRPMGTERRLARIGRGHRGDFESRRRRRRTKRAGRDPRKSATRLKPEGFVLAVDSPGRDRPVVWVVGADARGVLFGVGKLLETMKMTKGAATLDATDERGHVAGLSDSRPPARLPQSRQLVGRLGCAAVRSIHSRAGDLRLQLRREHPVPGRVSRVRSCASRARR